MIRLLVIDDHAAVRAGLVGLLRSEPGLVPVAAEASPEPGLAAARRERPDVALVDYNLPGDDGLSLCRKLRTLAHPPKVIIYTAYESDGLVVPAILAGAQGLVDKAAAPDDLFEAIRSVARGTASIPTARPALLEAAGSRIERRDVPILGMLMEGTPQTEIAAVLKLRDGELDERLNAMIGRLRPGAPR